MPTIPRIMKLGLEGARQLTTILTMNEIFCPVNVFCRNMLICYVSNLSGQPIGSFSRSNEFSQLCQHITTSFGILLQSMLYKLNLIVKYII